MADDRYNIRRPQPGRPSDRRVDEAYLRVRPELNGLEPFDEAEDIDVIDEVQRVVNNVRADVAYADPALGAALDTALNDTLPAKVAEVDAAVVAVNAEWADTKSDIAQSSALATAAAGITARANLAAITGADGYYRAMDTGEVYQRTGGVNTRRADLEALSPPALGLILAAQDATLQGSLDRAVTPKGREVYLPEGTYNVAALTLPDGVSLRGAGIGRTIITSSTAVDIITLGANCRLRDLTIRRGAANQRAIVDANPGTGYRPNALKRVRLEGFEARRGASFLRPNGLILTDVEADACWIPVEIDDPKGVVTLTRLRLTNTVTDRMLYGLIVKAGAVNTTGKVRVIEPYIRGANLDTTGFSAESWGILVFNVHGVEITKPNIEQCVSSLNSGGAILLGSQSWGAKVLGGSVNYNRLGVFVEHQPEANTAIQTGRVLGSVIDGVTAAYNGTTGINVSYGPTAVVTNCIAHSNGQDGICSDSDHNVITNNTVYNNWTSGGTPTQLVRAGIRVYGQYATISGNKCHDNQATPTQQYGIATNRRGHRISGNTGQGNGVALYYEDQAFDAVAVGNTTDRLSESPFIPLGQVIQQSNTSTAMYYPIATLPAGNSTQNKLVVEIEGGESVGLYGLRWQRVMMSAFAGFNYVHEVSGTGTNPQRWGVAAYTQADGTVQVFVKGVSGAFMHGMARAYWLNGNLTPPKLLTIGVGSSTVPSGTLALDTLDATNYPPNTVSSVGRLSLRKYTQGTLPSASAAADTLVYVTNPNSGSSRLAYSDGTSWVYLPAPGSGFPVGDTIQFNSPSVPYYYPVGTLPAGNATMNKLVVELLGGEYNASTGLRATKVVLSAFNGFNYTFETAGPGGILNLAVVAYTQADNTVQVFIRTRAGGGGFIHGSVRSYWQNGNFTAPVGLTLGVGTTTVPSGTLVLDTSDSTTYPPNVELGIGTVWMPRKITAASASNSMLFVDSADGKLKFKDSAGAVNLLY